LWLEPATGAPPRWNNRPDRLDMACLRTWIRTGRKIALRYRDEQDRESERIVWPVIVGYLDAVRLLIAWCERRQDFRDFRTDRVVEAVFLDEHYLERPNVLKAKWRRSLEPQCSDRGANEGFSLSLTSAIRRGSPNP
jgi:predicted DNA-binding transcriptional regulator YafY